MDSLSPYTAISPIDGRYRDKTAALSDYFSEFGLMKFRIFIEIEWLIYQVKIGITPNQFLSEKSLILSFKELSEIKNYENTTLHDIKAVEYYLKNKLKNSNIEELQNLVEYIHFLTTSEDINSPSYALILRHSIKEVLRPELIKTIEKLSNIALKFADVPLLSLTHGQPATPTTFGKEIAIYVSRLTNQLTDNLDKIKYHAKFGGATGNYNAHTAIYPNMDWPLLCKNFIEKLGLEYSEYTTQVESNDYISLICDTLSRINSIICDISVDMWLYIMRGVLILKSEFGQVGSSTMPHKINPICFENSEGNSELAISILQFLSRKLPRSRLQRDLSGSTCIRNIGVPIAHTLISLKSLNYGLDKIDVDINQTQKELNDNWSILSEPIQLFSKKHGIDLSFEKTKDLLMGKHVHKSDIREIIKEISQSNKEIEDELLKLNPYTYIGYSSDLAKKISNIYNIK